MPVSSSYSVPLPVGVVSYNDDFRGATVCRLGLVNGRAQYLVTLPASSSKPVMFVVEVDLTSNTINVHASTLVLKADAGHSIYTVVPFTKDKVVVLTYSALNVWATVYVRMDNSFVPFAEPINLGTSVSLGSPISYQSVPYVFDEHTAVLAWAQTASSSLSSPASTTEVSATNMQLYYHTATMFMTLDEENNVRLDRLNVPEFYVQQVAITNISTQDGKYTTNTMFKQYGADKTKAYCICSMTNGSFSVVIVDRNRRISVVPVPELLTIQNGRMGPYHGSFAPVLLSDKKMLRVSPVTAAVLQPLYGNQKIPGRYNIITTTSASNWDNVVVSEHNTVVDQATANQRVVEVKVLDSTHILFVGTLEYVVFRLNGDTLEKELQATWNTTSAVPATDVLLPINGTGSLVDVIGNKMISFRHRGLTNASLLNMFCNIVTISD